MFESVVIRQQIGSGGLAPLDIGFLAEAMLFYSEVHVVGNHNMLTQIVTACSPEILIELLERKHIRLTYERNRSAIATMDLGNINERHAPILISSEKYEAINILQSVISSITGRIGRSRRLTRRLLPLIGTISHEEELLSQAREDLSNPSFLADALPELLKYRTPGYELPPHIDLNIINEGGNFIFRSNLDLKNAAKFYTRRHESSFGMATLLTDIMAIRENLFFCARFPSELATDPVYGRIVQNRISEILRRTTASAEDRSVFHRLVFDGGRSVREAINSGRRNFKDLLVMLEKAEKFKKWLHTLEADEDLVREYFKEATSSTWIEKLPGKTMRWAVFTGLGVGIDALGAGGAGTAFGIGLGALDQFVLDKMLRGWKPNQFIDNTLQEFVS